MLKAENKPIFLSPLLLLHHCLQIGEFLIDTGYESLIFQLVLCQHDAFRIRIHIVPIHTVGKARMIRVDPSLQPLQI